MNMASSLYPRARSFLLIMLSIRDACLLSLKRSANLKRSCFSSCSTKCATVGFQSKYELLVAASNSIWMFVIVLALLFTSSKSSREPSFNSSLSDDDVSSISIGRVRSSGLTRVHPQVVYKKRLNRTEQVLWEGDRFLKLH